MNKLGSTCVSNSQVARSRPYLAQSSDEDLLKLWDVLQARLRQKMQELGAQQVVLGLSGGLDSAVVAALCTQCLGAQAVHAVMMPGPYSSEHSISDSKELARLLGFDLSCVPITSVYEVLGSGLEAAFPGSFEGLAQENTQSRLRMTTLMALSNAYGWALVNTSNYSEALLGYCTLYGDTAGVFAPVGGLFKTELYALVHALNAKSLEEVGEPLIPSSIVTKAPSAELAPYQEDEVSFGMSYERIDAYLYARCFDTSFAHDLSPEERCNIDNRIDSAAFKHRFLPLAFEF